MSTFSKETHEIVSILLSIGLNIEDAVSNPINSTLNDAINRYNEAVNEGRANMHETIVLDNLMSHLEQLTNYNCALIRACEELDKVLMAHKVSENSRNDL